MGAPGRRAIATVIVALVAGVSAGRFDVAAAQAVPPSRLAADATGAIPYFIASGADGSGYRPGDAELAAWALREWERISGSALRFRATGREDDASLRIRWLPWVEDGELGRMDPSVAGERVIASVTIRPDEDRMRPTIRRRIREDPLMRDVVLYYVCLHEIGHALGLSHSSNLRDVMWSGGTGVTLPIYDRYRKRLTSRDSLAQASWLSPDDVARLKALWP